MLRISTEETGRARFARASMMGLEDGRNSARCEQHGKAALRVEGLAKG
jgi:hypothetical protein